VFNTTKQHRQHGKVVNEKSTQPPNVLQKSGPSKQRTQSTTQEKNKSSIHNSDDEGDHNPPRGSIEKPHKIPITRKRKRKTNREGTNEVEPKDGMALEDLDLDANIKDITFLDEEKRVQESREFVAELVTQEPALFEEESMTLHNALFDKV
jgi:hypothetical protein